MGLDEGAPRQGVDGPQRRGRQGSRLNIERHVAVRLGTLRRAGCRRLREGSGGPPRAGRRVLPRSLAGGRDGSRGKARDRSQPQVHGALSGLSLRLLALRPGDPGARSRADRALLPGARLLRRARARRPDPVHAEESRSHPDRGRRGEANTQPADPDRGHRRAPPARPGRRDRGRDGSPSAWANRSTRSSTNRPRCRRGGRSRTGAMPTQR